MSHVTENMWLTKALIKQPDQSLRCSHEASIDQGNSDVSNYIEQTRILLYISNVLSTPTRLHTHSPATYTYTQNIKD